MDTTRHAETVRPLSDADLELIDAYRGAANYLSQGDRAPDAPRGRPWLTIAAADEVARRGGAPVGRRW